MIPIIASIAGSFLKDWIKNPFNKENLNKTLIIVIIILLVFSFKTCKSTAELKAEIKKQELIASNNYDALNGEIKILTTKNGELEYSKTILYTDADNLKKINAKLSDELKKEKGKVKVIVNTQTEIKYVPVSVPNYVLNYGLGKYGLSFKTTYKDSGLVSEMEGTSKFHVGLNNMILPDSTVITKNNLKIDITYGVRERDDKIEIFARSKSPLVSFTEIDGAYIQSKGNSILPNDPAPTIKPKHWTLGPQIGYTYNTTAQRSNYQFIGNLQYRMSNTTIGLQAGIGYTPDSRPDVYLVDYRVGARLQYNLFKW